MRTALKRVRKQKGTSSFAEQAARTIGARLRFLRKSQDRTLMELAKDSGVDIATICRIEKGQMTGTLESHIKLTTALGLKVTDLYEGIEEARIKDAVTFQSSSKHAESYVHEAGAYFTTMLTTDILKKKLMPVLTTIEPGGRTPKEEARVGTEKFLYVLDGALEATIGEKAYQVSRGSSLYLDASIPHTFKNTGRGTVRCVTVTTPPVL